MKKILLFIILFIVSPIVVYAADNCSSDQIEINSVELKNISGDTLEKEEAKVENGVLYTNLKFTSVGDSVKYRINIENKSNQDYYFDESNIKTETKYIDYEISYDDNSPVVKKKSSKNVDIKITYNREITDSEYHSDDFVNINLSNDKVIISNPKTKRATIIGILLFIVLVASLIVFKYKGMGKAMILLLIMLIPVGVLAICKIGLNMKCNISIEKKYTGYSYLYNEIGSGRLGEELNIQKKRFWCAIANENDGYYCALDSGFETEEECNTYIDQYYTPGNYSCISRERLYDDSLIFHEINPIDYERPYYIKLYIEKNVPKDVYACFKTDKEYCMRSGDDSFYSDNVAILSNQQSAFSHCEFGDEYSYCEGGNASLNHITLDKTDSSVIIGNSYGAQCFTGTTFGCYD